jgi:hypothetical protein
MEESGIILLIILSMKKSLKNDAEKNMPRPNLPE